MQVAFAQPHWLWIGALACAVLGGLVVLAARARRDAVRRFAAASPQSSAAPRRRLLRAVLAIAGVGMLCVALARPLAGYRWEQTPHQGVDLMFAVDTSKSMRAADIRPDRLTRAKLAVTDLARRFEGERLGLIAFAGDAFVQAPMTVDRGVFLEAVDALDTDVIPAGGSDLASAIRAAEQAMGSEPDHRKVLVLLSDGEDHTGTAVEAARDAAKHGLTIYTVGVGSPRGELIDIASADGRHELVRDESGAPVRSKLDEPTLRALAQITGGVYQPLGSDGRGLDALYANARSQLPQSTSLGTARKVYTERFQIPLAIGLGCVLLELLIGDRLRRTRRSASGTNAAGAALGIALFAIPLPAHAAPQRDAAVRSYNDGTAHYRSGDFAAAQTQFESALRTGDVGLQVDTYYDLGNARYRVGQASLASKDRDGAITSWKAAVSAYDAALALATTDEDARFNRDLVVRKLAALEAEKQREQDDHKQQNDRSSGHGQKDQKSQRQQAQGQQDPKSQGQQGPQDQNHQGRQGHGQDQNSQGQQGPQDPNNQGQQARGPRQQGQQGQKGQQGPQDPNHQGQQGPRDPNGQSQQSQRDPNSQGQQDPNSQGQQDPNSQGQQAQLDQKTRGRQGQPQNPKNQPPQGAAPTRDAPDAAERTKDRSPQPEGAAATPASGSPSAVAKQQAAAQAAADHTRRAAGQLTSHEAVQLLDSVERELKPLPIHGRSGGPPTTTWTKDW
jgi:Ca-activated chloride channel family protein